MSNVDALVARLQAIPHGVPIEQSGATAAISAISGHVVAAVMRSRGPRTLTVGEQRLLQSLGTITGHERCGTLYAGNVPAAATAAILLPHRLPATVRATLGIGLDGEALPGIAGMPIGRALTGLGGRREPLAVERTPGECDTAGQEVVVRSAARLWLDDIIGLVIERVYGEFLDAFAAEEVRR